MHDLTRSPPRRPPALAAWLLAATVLAGSALADDTPDPPGRVARVSLADGSVSLQPAGSETWVSDVANRPLAPGDRLWVCLLYTSPSPRDS